MREELLELSAEAVDTCTVVTVRDKVHQGPRLLLISIANMKQQSNYADGDAC